MVCKFMLEGNDMLTKMLELQKACVRLDSINAQYAKMLGMF